jgi:hypothetical protein
VATELVERTFIAGIGRAARFAVAAAVSGRTIRVWRGSI